MGEWMYRSTFSSLRHYLEVSGQLHAPAALPSEKESLYPLDRWLDGLQNRWTIWGSENSLLYRDSNFDPSVVQPIASRYTEWANTAAIPFSLRLCLLSL
jgi:hypothetical protein